MTRLPSRRPPFPAARPRLFAAAALALGLAGLSPSLLAAQTTRYLALVDGGKQAGQQVVSVAEDGTTTVDFVFKDNGRGPELKETYTLAEDGTYRSYQVSGSSTFGAKIQESFRRDGARAVWKTGSDAGEVDVAGTAQYAPLDSTPQSQSVLLAALAKRADGKLPLLPNGSLSARKLAEVEVSRGAERRKVQLMALTGQGFTPDFVWATTDAEPRLFASIYPGYLQLIEEGWQANAEALETRQKQAEGELLVDLRKKLGHAFGGTTLLRDVRVFDSERAELGPATDVVVADGRIVSIGAASKDLKADRVVEGGGRALLPGLFDMHGHLSRWDGGLNLAAGVTTVRDMGNDNATLQQMMGEIAAGTLMAPNVVPAGFIEGESQYSARNGFVVKDLAEAKKAVDWYAGHGYPQIKIYNSFPKAVLRDTVAYAHQKGLRVSGHVPAFLRAQDVAEQGFDEIQHINQLMLNFFVDEKTDTRTLQRFYLVADKTAGLDLDSKPVQDFIGMLAQKRIAIDPTLATFEFLHQRNGELSPIFAGIDAHMPPDVQRGRRAAEMDIPDEATAARYRKSYDKMVEFVGRAYKAGVPLLAGTDEVPGFTLQHELALYVRAGLTPGQALQVATRDAAKVARVDADRGAIAPGKRADLLLVDGDPTRDIGDIRKIALVLQGQTGYYPSEVYQALGVRPFAAPAKVSAAR